MTIETPVKPHSATTPAPPPDPSLRQAIPAPPPDVATRHERACAHCGSPLHPDQLACLVCGRMADDAGGRVSWRTWGLASATTLLLVGGTVGAAIAGLPHGKHVKKPLLSAVGPKKAIPPATAGTTSPGTSATTPLPGVGTATTPPALHTPKVHSSSPAPSHSSGSTSGSGSSGSSGSSGNSSSNTKPKKKKHKSTTPGASSQLFAAGVAPEDGQLFDPSGDQQDHPGDVINTYDNDSSTAWSTQAYNNGLGKDGVGIWVKAPSDSSFKGVGILDRTAGFDVEVRYANGSSPPEQLSGWTLAAKKTGASSRQQVGLPKGDARKADYYLVWITKLPAGKKRVVLSEIQLLQ
ncbi:MAG: eukaryotic-like serine/threonine-protein kinase [Thermoleophilaceae bacterium]|jgi:hypothetical protein|nr:eukaryotic-like serine/threonine-protein kinase [Thermoleophilaceae bacterium]